MHFVVDAQLPPALARLIAAQGHEAEHVYDFSKQDASDTEIWNYALSISAIIISKDEDFVIRSNMAGNGPPIVWIRSGNLSKQALIGWFQPLLPVIIEKIQSGEQLIELV